MYFDVLTTAAVADEIRERGLGGRVQATVLIDPLTLGLEVYARERRHYLVVSAHAGNARVHFTDHKVRRGVEEASPFLLLVRKYVRGARVSGLEHPTFERILRLSFDGPQGTA